MKRLPNPCQCPRLHVWTDGQPFKGQPPARWEGHATVVVDDENEPLTGPGELLCYKSIGDKTSNECEYTALITALEWAKGAGDVGVFHIIIDSELIIGHLFKDFICKAELRSYRDRVLELIKQTDARVTWQGRDYNKAGWYNAGVLLERAAAKRKRDKENGVARKAKSKVIPNTTGHKRWKYQARAS